MLPLRHARQWRIAGLSLLFLVFLATLMPAVWLFPDKIKALSWFGHFDKWLHALTFLVMAVWFAGQYQRHSYWRIAAGLLAFGFLIEFCQLMVGYRTADWLDIGANTAGIIIGLAVAMAGLGGWSLRVEDWYSARKTGTGID